MIVLSHLQMAMLLYMIEFQNRKLRYDMNLKTFIISQIHL